MESIERKGLGILLLCILSVVLACSSYKADKHYRNGISFQNNGEISKAVDEYSRTLHFDPTHLDARMARASLYESQESWEKAISEYEAVLAANPAALDAEYNLGTIYRRLNHWDEAVKYYNNVITKDSGNAESYYWLGWIYKKRQENNKAMEAFTKAVTINEGFSQAHYQLAVLLFIDGKFEQAKKHAESAQKDCPQSQKLLSLIEEETKESKG